MTASNELKDHDFGSISKFYTGLGDAIGSTIWSSGDLTVSAPKGRSVESDSKNYPHPAAESLSIRGKLAEKQDRMHILASTQGMHAVLRLAMEERIMHQLQPRLPGLYSYHPLAAQLDGRLDEIDVSDFLNPPQDAETIGIPYLMMERKLGIL